MELRRGGKDGQSPASRQRGRLFVMGNRTFALLFLGSAALIGGCGSELGRAPAVAGTGGGSTTGTGSGGATGVTGAGGATPVVPPGSSTLGGGITCHLDLAGFSPMPAGASRLTLGATVSMSVPPPAISGGTLLALSDKTTVVAADSDRDQVYLVDLPARAVRATVVLKAGDEPGRVIEDAAGFVHVSLRRGGAVVKIDPALGTVVERRAVCAAPRGLAHDPATNLIHVACAGGELISLRAAGGAAVRSLKLDSDLRDVVVQGDALRVSRFRSAELLTVDRDGKVMGRMAPPVFRAVEARGGQAYSPSVAWRTVGMPDGRVAMVHQRGVDDEVQNGVAGGYGGFDACHTVVHSAMTTVGKDGSVENGAVLADLPLVVDMALSRDGTRVAFVSAANAHTAGGANGVRRSVHATSVDAASGTGMPRCKRDIGRQPCAADALPEGLLENGSTRTCANSVPAVVVGEAIAVAYTADDVVIVQSREPARLNIPGVTAIVLSDVSVVDTGHTLFHANAGAGLACASCHPEGNDDGRVWNFACAGARRTQSLQIGIRGTEPFHWSGDEKDFTALVHDVFSTRMSGPQLLDDQIEATLSWVHLQPRIARSPGSDPAAVDRGRILFNDPAQAACATCHAGERLTDNRSVDVGTGGVFQVPSLVGIANHDPFMHTGCAKTLADRFSPACGGGDKHGVTSKLTPGQLSDLVSFLETL